MIHRIAALVVKELLQFSRDRLLLVAILLGPALQLWLVGGGSGAALTGLPVAVVDQDRSALSREIAAAVENTAELSVRYAPDNPEAARRLLDQGRITAFVVIPERFAADLLGGRRTPVQLVLDGTNVAAAAAALDAAQGAIESLGWDVALQSAPELQAARGIDLRQEALYNQALDNRLYEVTAHLAFFTFVVVVLTGVMGIVREVESGTAEQLLITPLGRVELILGKAIGPALLGLANFTLMAGMARLIFTLPMRGSWLLLGAMAVLYLISEVCVALMISTVSRTEAQAITIVFIWIMAALTLSGFLVPIANLPGVLRGLAALLPLQHFIEIVRAVMLKGAGLAVLWPNIAALVGLDVTVVAITSLLLRRLSV